jgi:hypothetical protein
MKLVSQDDYNKFVRKAFIEPFDSVSFSPQMMAFAMTQEFDDEESRMAAALFVAWCVFFWTGDLPNNTEANSKARWVAHDVVHYTDLGRRMHRDMINADW